MRKAKMVGIDEWTDLAVLKIEVEGAKIVPIEIQKSVEAQVGQKVIVIGNPYGYSETLSTGIVSSNSRKLETAGVLIDGMI